MAKLKVRGMRVENGLYEKNFLSILTSDMKLARIS